ncbi:hypothetical protein G7046_g7770 [Stylonectria norvegica]|nr:hypothetical protein G7046_g7770 [Stylonectria norvegica]
MTLPPLIRKTGVGVWKDGKGGYEELLKRVKEEMGATKEPAGDLESCVVDLGDPGRRVHGITRAPKPLATQARQLDWVFMPKTARMQNGEVTCSNRMHSCESPTGEQRQLNHPSHGYRPITETREEGLPVSGSDMETRAQIIAAPARPKQIYKKSIFLAGTTSKTGEPDWRETLTDALAEWPITIFNPKRDDWDSIWTEDFSDERWKEQVEWELEMQDLANVIVVLFHGVSSAPVSLLELGLHVRSGKVIACVLDGYSKKGNVKAVCLRYQATFVETEDDLRRTVIERLDESEDSSETQLLII